MNRQNNPSTSFDQLKPFLKPREQQSEAPNSPKKDRSIFSFGGKVFD